MGFLCFGSCVSFMLDYIITFQLGCSLDKVYQVGIAKPFKSTPCRTNYARFDATNLEKAPILKTNPGCVACCFQLSENQLAEDSHIPFRPEQHSHMTHDSQLKRHHSGMPNQPLRNPNDLAISQGPKDHHHPFSLCCRPLKAYCGPTTSYLARDHYAHSLVTACSRAGAKSIQKQHLHTSHALQKMGNASRCLHFWPEVWPKVA